MASPSQGDDQGRESAVPAATRLANLTELAAEDGLLLTGLFSDGYSRLGLTESQLLKIGGLASQLAANEAALKTGSLELEQWYAECRRVGDDVLALRATAFQVPVAPHVEDFAMRLVTTTRAEHPHLRSGASPRALRALLLGGRVRALLAERYNVSSEDIRALARPALRHRITLSFEAESQNVTPDQVVEELVAGL